MTLPKVCAGARRRDAGKLGAGIPAERGRGTGPGAGDGAGAGGRCRGRGEHPGSRRGLAAGEEGVTRPPPTAEALRGGGGTVRRSPVEHRCPRRAGAAAGMVR